MLLSFRMVHLILVSLCTENFRPSQSTVLPIGCLRRYQRTQEFGGGEQCSLETRHMGVMLSAF